MIMKQFIDNLISRLEEKKQQIDANEGFIELGTKWGYKQAIGIVNQLAEEYKGGWISVKDRLPKDSGEYLVTQYNEDAIDEYCDGHRIETLFFDEHGWWDDISSSFGWEVIAWMPLPSPYQKEGE